jgi:hypothetical protein
MAGVCWLHRHCEALMLLPMINTFIASTGTFTLLTMHSRARILLPKSYSTALAIVRPVVTFYMLLADD